MSEYDFERMNEYSLLDKRFAFAPRKRVSRYDRLTDTPSDDSSSTEGQGAFGTEVNGSELPDVIKEYENDVDGYEDHEQEWQKMRSQANLRPFLSQGATYLILLAFLGAFVMIINWYNMKQLAQLKEEYGFDEKQPSPEFWWRKSVIYHIHIHSYQDSDGDGIGDLTGIRQHLDHLVYLGVDAVLLSSIFDSPFEDYGRDIRDYKMVNLKYGSIQDFETLVAELHERGIKVMIEIIPNHTSRRHKWFLASRQGGLNNTFKNYYIWNRGFRLANGTRVPPNNWVSRYGGSAWTYDEEKQSYYYHHYHLSMPDLNLRDRGVRSEILDVFKFWLDKGVDALYVRDVHILYESDDLQLDEPLLGENEPVDSYTSLKHIYSEHQPEVHDYLGSWREFIETYCAQAGRRVGLVVDVGNSAAIETVKYYFTGPDAPVSHALFNINTDCGGRCMHELVDSWLTHLPEERDTIWMMSGPSWQRVNRLKGAKYQTAFNVLSMLLPGAVVSYYGDEIGMADDVDATKSDPSVLIMENAKRSAGYSPMQWSSKQHAGFTTFSKPWIPVHPQYSTNNVEVQKIDPTGRSSLQIYQRLTHLRKERSFTSSRIQFQVVNDNVLSFIRFARDSAPYLVALNFGQLPSTDDYTLMTGVGRGKVVLYTGRHYKVKDGDLLSLSQLMLYPGDGVVVLLVLEDEFERP